MKSLLSFGVLLLVCLIKGQEECIPKVTVCYFANWVHYQLGDHKYSVDDIDPTLCSHFIYAFAVLDANTLLMKSHDPWTDLPAPNLNFYQKFTGMKKAHPDRKFLLAIGGWNDSQFDKYSRLVGSASTRSAFIRHAVNFLQQYGFDGLDLDWEYPAAADKANFATFVSEIKKTFSAHNLLVTAAVSAAKFDGYDVPKLGANLDLINVMTYDLHGSWEKNADHHAPLFPRPNINDNLNVDAAVKKWIQMGSPANKIVLGIPLYGRSFTLSSSKHDPPAPASGGGIESLYEGVATYLEVCKFIKYQGYAKEMGPYQHLVGPYAYKGNQWVGYDDVAIITNKMKYIHKENLAGAMVWSIDQDDSRNVCGDGKYPLMNAIRDSQCLVPPTVPTKAPTVATDAPTEQTKAPTVPTKAPTEPTEAPTIKPPGNGCDYQCPADYAGLAADPCDCQKYYNCHYGQTFHQSCTSALLFNPETLNCDWPNNVKCDSGEETPPPAQGCEVICMTVNTPPLPDPCDSTKYYLCDGSMQAIFYTCPSGTEFDPALKFCNWI